MADREKVILGLECLANENAGCYTDCPYYESHISASCFRKMAADALSLLKAQEPVKPGHAYSGSGITWWNICGNCKTAINPNDKFCHECGMAVKWDD